MIVEKKHTENFTILYVEGLIKLGESAEFFSAALENVLKNESTNVIIDFTKIDHGLLTPQWIHDLRQICLTELSALYATEMFLRDFYTDIDFCSFVSIWFYEEMKHHMVLRKYLEQCGETFDEEKELPELGEVDATTRHHVGARHQVGDLAMPLRP